MKKVSPCKSMTNFTEDIFIALTKYFRSYTNMIQNKLHAEKKI